MFRGKIIAFRADGELVAAIDRAAADERRNASDWLRLVVEDTLNSRNRFHPLGSGAWGRIVASIDRKTHQQIIVLSSAARCSPEDYVRGLLESHVALKQAVTEGLIRGPIKA